MVPTLIYCLVESRINGCAMTFMYISISTEVITCMHVCVCVYIYKLSANFENSTTKMWKRKKRVICRKRMNMVKQSSTLE